MYDEILDEVEELATRMSTARLAQTLEERADALAPGVSGRAAWLCHAGERWEMADDLERAKACFEEAVRDGGEAYVDPRAQLVNVLLDLGETQRADELLVELRRDVAEGKAAPGPVYEFVGEALELHDRLEEALRWFSWGLTSAHREDPEEVDHGCLNGRFRVRRQLGLPHDRYDELCEEIRRGYQADLLDDDKRLLGSPAEDRSVSLVMLYWPAEEFARLLERWPEMAQDYGSAHAEHRSTVERRLRELSEESANVSIGVGNIEEYLEFATGRGDSGAESSTRAGYAAHLGFLGRGAPWPPGRNDRCWCGSGLKYKKCCGALRFAAPE